VDDAGCLLLDVGLTSSIRPYQGCMRGQMCSAQSSAVLLGQGRERCHPVPNFVRQTGAQIKPGVMGE